MAIGLAMDKPRLFLANNGAMADLNIANRVALAFFGAWVAIAYAGADHPPPPAFLLLIGLLLACAIVLRDRLPTYLRWHAQKTVGRFTRVIRDGALGGAAVYLFLLVVGPGEPAIEPDLIDRLIGAAVVIVLGVTNTLMAYGCAVWFAQSE